MNPRFFKALMAAAASLNSDPTVLGTSANSENFQALNPALQTQSNLLSTNRILKQLEEQVEAEKDWQSISIEQVEKNPNDPLLSDQSLTDMMAKLDLDTQDKPLMRVLRRELLEELPGLTALTREQTTRRDVATALGNEACRSDVTACHTWLMKEFSLTSLQASQRLDWAVRQKHIVIDRAFEVVDQAGKVTKYDRLRFLGRGSFGDVYDLGDGKVLKFLKKSLVEDDELRGRRDEHNAADLRKEYDMLKKFQGGDAADHIIQVGEFFDSIKTLDIDGKEVISKGYIMEKAESDLQTMVKNKVAASETFTTEEAFEMSKQILTAVSCLHEKNVAHLDIKLDNFLVVTTPTGKKQIKLGDLGQAVQTNEAVNMQAFGRGALPIRSPFGRAATKYLTDQKDLQVKFLNANPDDVVKNSFLNENGWPDRAKNLLEKADGFSTAIAMIQIMMTNGEFPWKQASETDPRYRAWIDYGEIFRIDLDDFVSRNELMPPGVKSEIEELLPRDTKIWNDLVEGDSKDPNVPAVFTPITNVRQQFEVFEKVHKSLLAKVLDNVDFLMVLQISWFLRMFTPRR